MCARFRTIKELANTLGVSGSLVSNVMAGRRFFVSPIVRSKVYEVTRIELFQSPEPTVAEHEAFKDWVQLNIVRGQKKRPRANFSNEDSLTETLLPGQHFKTQLELAGALQIPKGTLSSFISTPGKKILKSEQRKNIFKITGITSYDADKPSGSERQEFLDWISKNVQDRSHGGKRQMEGSLRNRPAADQRQLRVPQKSALLTVTEIASLIETIDSASTKLRQLIGTDTLDAVKKLRGMEQDETESLVSRFLAAFHDLMDLLRLLKKSTPELRKKIKEEISPRDIGYATSFLRALYDEDHFSDFMFFSDYKVGETDE